jgi:hypothetical protein
MSQSFDGLFVEQLPQLFLSVRTFVWHPASGLVVQLKKFCSQTPGAHAPWFGPQMGLGAWGNEHGTQPMLLHPLVGFCSSHFCLNVVESMHDFWPAGQVPDWVDDVSTTSSQAIAVSAIAVAKPAAMTRDRTLRRALKTTP